MPINSFDFEQGEVGDDGLSFVNAEVPTDTRSRICGWCGKFIQGWMRTLSDEGPWYHYNNRGHSCYDKALRGGV